MLTVFRPNVIMCRSIASSSVVQPTAVLENGKINPLICNRNPRNMDRLCISHKPLGYYLETKGRSFWNKLQINSVGRHLIGEVLHHSGVISVSASTKEWAIKQHLYRTNDKCAYVNLARVLAQRCLESGITEMLFDKNPAPDTKLLAFIETFEKEGVSLNEPKPYHHARPSDKYRYEKPWEVHE